MSITDQIKGTQQYRELSTIQQKLIVQKQSLIDIKLGINMSKLTSFLNWKQKNSPRLIVENIVKQIIG